MGCSTLEGKRLRIVDARPIINAKGNALMGKGHEIIGRLGGEMCTTLSFAGIANIHVMRENYGALRQICCELTRSCNWFHMLQETKWLLHLSTLIKGSLVVALHLERGDPVLVHCSDGWDRTAQMVSLAQLMLDPYYRTIAGFRSLISKDFSTFGHMFHHRSGLVSPEEGSPIFLQFLDAVWQIWRQMPWEFEFTDSLLELIAYAVGTRFTDDFVFDNEKSRLEFEDVLKQIVKTSHCSSCRAKDMTAAGPPRFSTSGCTPVHGGGSYYSPSAGGDCAAEGGLNTAYAVDFGEFSDDDDSDKGESRTDYASRTGHKMGTATDSMHVDAAGMGDDVRDGLHQTEREREGFRKIFGDGSSRSLSSGDEGTGGTLDVEAPTQLFVVAQPVATPLDRTPPTAVRYGSGPINLHMPDNSQVPATQSDTTEPVGSGINRLSGMNIDAATPHVMDSNAHPGIAAQRPTRLLRPCFDIQAMAVWEGVHFSSIPMAHTFTAASASFSRGLEILHREELGKNKQLEELVHSQERTIRELSEQLQAQKKKVMHLEKELATSTAAAAALDEKRNSATLGDNCLDIDDYVMFGETEEHLFRCVDKREENR
ncbi:MTMR4, partial [Symbiodinium microadriaticum]